MRRLSDRIKNYSTVATAFRGVTVELPKFTGAIEIGEQGAGAAGQVLVSGGSDGDPQWVDATSTMSASEMLTSIKTVDGATSGLDADTLDGQHGSYYAPLASPALTGTPTAPTAAAGTNTTQLATTAFVGTAVSNLVASAPATLDTLNELAAALGDDPNFATTVTNSIATKLPLDGGTMTGSITFAAGQLFDGRDVSVDGSKLDGIEAGATADQTASEILTAIKTVDGAASGLDADLLDGQHGSYYYAASNPSGYTTYTANQAVDTTSSPTFAELTVNTNLNMGSWGFVNNGTKLTIQYGGVNVGSIDNSGNLIVTGNVTAYGTP